MKILNAGSKRIMQLLDLSGNARAMLPWSKWGEASTASYYILDVGHPPSHWSHRDCQQLGNTWQNIAHELMICEQLVLEWTREELPEWPYESVWEGQSWVHHSPSSACLGENRICWHFEGQKHAGNKLSGKNYLSKERTFNPKLSWCEFTCNESE